MKTYAEIKQKMKELTAAKEVMRELKAWIIVRRIEGEIDILKWLIE